MSGPDLSVVIPSHGRRLRLRWLLNALEEQTAPAGRWEVIVVHDYDHRDTEAVLERHPLAVAGTLRHIRIAPGTGSPARQRNLGWREARAPLVLFTDDDCRPAPDWVQAMLEAAVAHPGAIVQGRTRPDPHESAVRSSPHARTLDVKPPSPFAQTCNILYPRAVLEACAGFDEAFPGAAGEDLDLLERAKALGTACVGEERALVHHAVVGHTLLDAVRMARKWEPVVFLVKRHPHLRREHRYPLGIFWRATHFRLAVAALGVTLGVRVRAPFVLLAAPYCFFAVTRRGRTRRAVATGLAELPGQAVVDAAEMVALARASARERTLLL